MKLIEFQMHLISTVNKAVAFLVWRYSRIQEQKITISWLNIWHPFVDDKRFSEEVSCSTGNVQQSAVYCLYMPTTGGHEAEEKSLDRQSAEKNKKSIVFQITIALLELRIKACVVDHKTSKTPRIEKWIKNCYWKWARIQYFDDKYELRQKLKF